MIRVYVPRVSLQTIVKIINIWLTGYDGFVNWIYMACNTNGIEDEDVESEPEHPLVSRPDFVPDTSRLVDNNISCLVGEASGVMQTSRQQNKSIIPVIERLNLNDGSSRSETCNLGNNFLPNNPRMLKNYYSRISCGIYSEDGKYFLSATHDKQLYVYSTHNGRLKPYRTIQACDVGWSILSVAFSPDNSYIAYSTWSETLFQCPLLMKNENDSSNGMQTLQLHPKERPFCVFSIAFSNDGRNIICGANDNRIHMYDRQRNQKFSEIESHDKHVNAIHFADDSSQIFFSGSDDGLCKVWDMRRDKMVGMFAGHQDGITYIDSRGDQRYLISNSKDQTIKLWDMRRYSTETVSQSMSWDYRINHLTAAERGCTTLLKNDTSVMTYYGHSIRKTLIRCHFSPKITTGQRYIYTGDSRGRLIIYDLLTGKIVHNVRGHTGCVRDVSWHPYGHNILTSSWDGKLCEWSYMGDRSPDV
ncbi:DDB1- and CUL4-associated factor 11-like isoform X2 [Nylanderia fulva]|uniref:DDB1- and CUL4-associated factor 11-like isoform X2 n=1 Tax=Nylanderia fulva TaxID=613905 RepID=UPI0010FB5AAF|nr:DDB1- and CUL4-associated factor 11-like isoform X2 [Nylanderia fulva]